MKTIQKVAKKAQAGFTLVELLLVITILGVLAAVAVQNFGGIGTEARVNATRTTIAAIESAARTYEVRTGKYPDSIDDMLQAVGNAEAPLDKKSKNDSWGNAINFRRTGNTFEIRSAGPDGNMNTEDDITN